MKYYYFGFLFLCYLSCLMSAPTAWKFSSTPDSEIQPFFKVRAEGWLGSDVATSIQLDGNKYLWVFGDTLVGQLINNNGKMVRDIKHMPRNSIALTTVNESNHLISPLEFYWKIGEGKEAMHIGFFSPPNNTHWFWVISGVKVGSSLVLFGYDTFQNTSGMWGFATSSIFCIRVDNPLDNPMNWKYSMSSISNTNSSFVIGASVAISNGYAYITGSNNNAITILARIETSSLLSFQWQALEYWAVSEGTTKWLSFSPHLQFQSLFPQPPSEDTLQYHPFLQQWFILILTPFSTEVQITMAPDITGPWSPFQKVYEIPAPWNKSPVFCYAVKSHPELIRNKNEIVFSFMSNEPIEVLSPNLEVYVPQIIRTTISAI